MKSVVILAIIEANDHGFNPLIFMIPTGYLDRDTMFAHWGFML